jgi:hypothetical protein
MLASKGSFYGDRIRLHSFFLTHSGNICFFAVAKPSVVVLIRRR